jgi:hypothetical protein
MSRARSLLDRVRAIEASNKHQLLIKIGSFERLEKIMSQPLPEVDPRVGPFLLECVRGWINGTDRTDEAIPEEFRV